MGKPEKDAYRAKLLDPRWQKRRLEILERDEWACQICFATDQTLHVHHRFYVPGEEPWEHSDRCLVTLCADCHEIETAEMSHAARTLIDELKGFGFFSSDLIALACAIGASAPLHMPDVVASAWARMLVSPGLQRDMIAQYLDDLGEIAQRRRAEKSLQPEQG